MSRYAFDLSARTAKWAEEHGVTAVKVEQMCARPKKKKDDSDDDDDGDEGSDDDAAVSREADYIHDETRKDDLEVWAVVGTAPYRADGRQEVSAVPALPSKAKTRYRSCLATAYSPRSSHTAFRYAWITANAPRLRGRGRSARINRARRGTVSATPQTWMTLTSGCGIWITERSHGARNSHVSCSCISIMTRHDGMQDCHGRGCGL